MRVDGEEEEEKEEDRMRRDGVKSFIIKKGKERKERKGR